MRHIYLPHIPFIHTTRPLTNNHTINIKLILTTTILPPVPLFPFPFKPSHSGGLHSVSIHSFLNLISNASPILTILISITPPQLQFNGFSIHISLSTQLTPFTPIHTQHSHSFYGSFFCLSSLHTQTLNTLLSLCHLTESNRNMLTFRFIHFILECLRESSCSSIPSANLPIQRELAAPLLPTLIYSNTHITTSNPSFKQTNITNRYYSATSINTPIFDFSTSKQQTLLP